ncbi:hypothetical protein FIBSPDRAFT_533561 [Athelia psychrophila]|uniref:Uncharacterized protein n=1 Tax=Athelia psychrophila TaxID=1759441 RepID=A0A166JB47_9AGAM|nr:hypothetical protein FIBSPDRAFT_533561 [Fibularhizoctonia sp. CBS 109695]
MFYHCHSFPPHPPACSLPWCPFLAPSALLFLLHVAESGKEFVQAQIKRPWEEHNPLMNRDEHATQKLMSTLWGKFGHPHTRRLLLPAIPDTPSCGLCFMLFYRQKGPAITLYAGRSLF